MKKPSLILWQELTYIQVEILMDCESNDILRDNIRKIFDISRDNDADVDIKSEILIDMYFYAFKYSMSQKFNAEQISVIIGLLKQIHQVNVESSFDNFEDVWKYFIECLKLHSVHRPPYSLELFNPDQYKHVIQYFVDTYFKHIKMYKYAFTPEILLDLKIEYPDMKPETLPEEPGVEVEETPEIIDEDKQNEDLTEKEDIIDDEPDNIKQLRKFIRTFLTEEVKKMKTTVDDRLKTVKESLNSKLSSSEGDAANKGRKSGKGGSAKGKKK